MSRLREKNHSSEISAQEGALSSKAKILFIGEAVTAAHVLRPLALAKSLMGSYEVSLACDERYKQEVESSGVQWYPLACIRPEVFSQRLTQGKAPYTAKELDLYILDEKKLLDRIQPNLVVSDFRISLPISCALKDIKLITLINAQWSPCADLPIPLPEIPANKILGTRLMKSMTSVIAPLVFKKHCRMYNRVRQSYGLDPLKTLQDIYSTGDTTLYLDSPDLFETKNLPNHHRFIGPVHGTPNTHLPKWWNTLPKDKPIVFISPGSSGSVDAMKKVIKALSSCDLTIMVATTDRMDGIATADNVYTANYIPGQAAAEVSDLVICNGGSGMSYMALAAGTPVLSIPVLMDQYYVAEAIERKCAGRVIRSGQVKSREVQRVVEEMLSHGDYKKNSERLRSSLESLDTMSLFSEVVEEFVAPVIANEVKQRVRLEGAVTQRIHNLMDSKIIAAEPREEEPVTIELATREEDLIDAYALIHKQYCESNYMDKNSTNCRTTLWNALPGTYTLVAKKRGVVIGTATYIIDSDAGLPSDDISKEELNALRQSGRRLCEVSGLAVDNNCADSSLLMDMFQYGLKLMKEHLDVTDYVITVNPRHKLFYRKMLCFEQVSDAKVYGKVKGAPGITMRLNLEILERVYLEKYGKFVGRKNLHHFFFMDKQVRMSKTIPLEIIRREKLLNQKTLHKIFEKHSQVLSQPEDYAIFKRQWLKLESQSHLELRRGA